jgi:hypothetical protein
MNSNNVLVTILAILILALSFFAGYSSKKMPDPVTTYIETVDTVFVHHTIRERFFNDRYYPVIDTIYIENTVHEIATLDTLILGNGYEVSTNVRYYYPDRYFAFLQHVEVDRDTIYVNRDKIITQTTTIKKTNWITTAFGTLAGFVGGVLIMK